MSETGPGATNVAIVGCGYVFDHYMTTAVAHQELRIAGVHDIDAARAETVARHYGLKVYPDLKAIINDPDVHLVLNLTSIESHYDVTSQLLEGGKHVYTEKPVTTSLADSKRLFEIAEQRGLVLASAPSNLFSDTVQTMWRAVRQGAIGQPLLVYAEFDDNPVYLMKPEGWRSRTGAPWPYLHEYEQGCTVEHVGYHLVWICAIFGPAVSVTAYSSVVVPNKTNEHLDPPDTPDFSVACIRFASGVVARITCSIAAPLDHRMRIIGDGGEVSSDTYRHYQSPVLLEQFTPLTLNARKARSVRTNPALGRLFGVGGRPVPLIRHWKSDATRLPSPAARTSPLRRLVDKVKRREVGAQDKMLGVAEVARALRDGQPCPLPPDFLLHINELTLAIQNAGPESSTTSLTTTFAALHPMPSMADATDKHLSRLRQGRTTGIIDTLIDRLHRH